MTASLGGGRARRARNEHARPQGGDSYQDEDSNTMMIASDATAGRGRVTRVTSRSCLHSVYLTVTRPERPLGTMTA
jgi:hypothetical protein